jgi:hypothetical protein
LDCWHQFETEHPSAFLRMYQFWVQKRAANRNQDQRTVG